MITTTKVVSLVDIRKTADEIKADSPFKGKDATDLAWAILQMEKAKAKE